MANQPEAVLDSWAWVEIVQATPVGQRLYAHYVVPRKSVTPAMAIAEVTAKMHRAGRLEVADEFVRAVRVRSRIHAMDDDVGALAGQLLSHLKRRDRDASLADAVMLATARTLGLPLISRDPCFSGCADVRAE